VRFHIGREKSRRLPKQYTRTRTNNAPANIAPANIAPANTCMVRQMVGYY